MIELQDVVDPVTFVADLDRCEHGRHRGDACSGSRPAGCGGVSKGNPLARPESDEESGAELYAFGLVVGYDIGARPYVIVQDAPDAGVYERGQRVKLLIEKPDA